MWYNFDISSWLAYYVQESLLEVLYSYLFLVGLWLWILMSLTFMHC